MPSLNSPAKLLKSLEEKLAPCIRCGLCQAVCPLYRQTGRETDVARGKLALLDGLLREALSEADAVNQRLGKCLLCGSCAANCPGGVNATEIFIKARIILNYYLGFSPLKKLIFRGALAKPVFFNRLLELGSKVQKLFVKPANPEAGTFSLRFPLRRAKGALADDSSPPPKSQRHFAPLASQPFHRSISSADSSLSDSGLKQPGLKAAFFVGCLIDKVFPRVAEAALKALRHHRAEVLIPRDQACCGMPALSAGDLDAYRRLVEFNLEKFDHREFDVLITACASCCFAIKKIWPMMAEEWGGLGETLNALADKTMDISVFLLKTKNGRTDDNKTETKTRTTVAYHDSCHLKKSLGVSAEPRELIRSSPGYQLAEMRESDWCCGMGGSFNLGYYPISSAIGQNKRDNIAAAGCQTVAAGCPACMLQISDSLSKAGDPVRVKHTVEIYAESIR